MSRLGVDIGGVIIHSAESSEGGVENTSFKAGGNYLDTPVVPGAFETLRTIREYGFGIWVISKCGPVVQQRSLEWLAAQDFYGRTGIKRENVHFTPTRIGKAAIARRLELSHFIDDRLEVLSYLKESVANLLLFSPDPSEVQEYAVHLPAVTVVRNWQEVRDQLIHV